MIHTLIALLNVFVLYVVIYTAVHRLSAINAQSLIKLTSVVLLFTALSILYYLMAVINQDFAGLLIFMTVVNIPLAYFCRSSFTEIVSFNGVNWNSKSRFWPLIALLFFTLYFFLFASKYGGWDAWAMWNLKAKLLYYSSGWKNLFLDRMHFSSPDYPLMLPATIAFFWSVVHNTSPFVPMLFSYLVFILIPLIIYYSLLNKGLGLFACLSLVVFITDHTYRSLAIAQESDVLFSMLILLVVVHYSYLKKASDHHVFLLAFICASSGWVKNEGIVFSLLFTLCFLIKNYKDRLAILKYGGGFVIPMLIVISFKWFYAPANSIVAHQHGVSSFRAHLLAPAKYMTIGKAVIDMIFTNYLMLPILAVVVFLYNAKFLLSLPLMVIYLLMGAYFVAYLAAPGDLNWLLSTSLIRLVEHVFPALIFLLLFGLKGISQTQPLHLAGKQDI